MLISLLFRCDAFAASGLLDVLDDNIRFLLDS
jgi:hypothetical protein